MSDDNPFRAFVENFNLPSFSDVNLKDSIRRIRQSLYYASRTFEKDAPEMAELTYHTVPGPGGSISARMYTPLGAGIGPAPGILFFHGGGFVLGDLDGYDIVCMRLADGARCRVISFDYRLAPEHTFPAAHDDAMACWLWALENADELGLDPERLAIAGDSAGGNLSAFIAQTANVKKTPAPAFQLLLYPLVQFVDIRTKKMTLQESGGFVSANVFDYFRDSYIANDSDRMDPRVSPLFAPEDAFKGLAPAHIVLCGWDPLKDEGRAYADKMASFGVPVTVREYAGMAHGFMNFTALSDAVKHAIRDAGEVTGRALGAI